MCRRRFKRTWYNAIPLLLTSVGRGEIKFQIQRKIEKKKGEKEDESDILSRREDDASIKLKRIELDLYVKKSYEHANFLRT